MTSYRGMLPGLHRGACACIECVFKSKNNKKTPSLDIGACAFIRVYTVLNISQEKWNKNNKYRMKFSIYFSIFSNLR